MCRLQTIDKYYNNLQYNESNREASINIYTYTYIKNIINEL